MACVRALTRASPYLRGRIDRASVRGRLRADRYDVVVVEYSEISAMPQDVCQAWGGPGVADLHNVDVALARHTQRLQHAQAERRRPSISAWRPTRQLWRIERGIARSYARVTTVSEVDAAALRRLAPGATIDVVPNGVDVDYFGTAKLTRCATSSARSGPRSGDAGPARASISSGTTPSPRCGRWQGARASRCSGRWTTCGHTWPARSSPWSHCAWAAARASPGGAGGGPPGGLDDARRGGAAPRARSRPAPGRYAGRVRQRRHGAAGATRLCSRTRGAWATDRAPPLWRGWHRRAFPGYVARRRVARAPR